MINNHSQANPIDNPEKTNLNILVVEDDMGLNHLIQKILAKEDFIVSGAFSGMEALNAIMQNDNRFIILDYSLPDMSAGVLIENLERKGKKPPFMIMTGKGDEKIAVEMMKIGAREYLIKDENFIESLPRIVGRAVNDISRERKYAKAQKDLAETEKKINYIIETAQEGIWSMDAELKTVFVNKKMAEMLGYTQDEMLGKTVDGFIAKEELSNHQNKMKKRREGVSEIYERKFVKKNGETIILQVAASALADANGKFNGSFAMFTDITESKSLDEKIKHQEQIYREAISASDAVAYKREYKIPGFIFIDAGIEKITGYPPNELTDALWASLVQESVVRGDAEGMPLKEAVRKTRNGEIKRWRADYRIKTRYGEEKWLADSSIQIVDKTGKPEGALGILQDITERKKIETALQKSEALYHSLFQSAPDGIFLIKDGVFVDCNRKACEIFGCSKEQLIGKHPYEISPAYQPNGDSSKEASYRIINDAILEKLYFFEWQHMRSNGSVFDTEVTLNCIGLDNVKMLIAIVRDVSEKKKVVEERKRLENQMQHLQKLESLGLMAGMIAHDFSNILIGVVGNADIALDEMSPTAPGRERIHEIEREAKRATELCHQLLAYSGKGKFIIEPIDLNKLIEETQHMLEISISKKAVLKFHFTQNLPAIEADVTQMRQILMNLMLNASDAIGEKSGVISITTGVMECDKAYLRQTFLDTSLSEGIYVYLEVADTGCGMDEATKQKIFEPFFSTKFTGRGLGLAAVLGIVKAHRGALKVYSEVGQGSTFKILLPASSQTPSSTTAQTIKEEKWKGSGLFLVVDDEQSARTITKIYLEKAGFSVITAANGKEGVEIFKQRSGEIVGVLLDLTMPHMGGEEAFRELRRIKPDIRVVLSSGYSEYEITDRFAGKGLAGFIQKPYKSAELMNIIKEIFK